MSPSSGKNIYRNFYILNFNINRIKLFLIIFYFFIFTIILPEIYGEEEKQQNKIKKSSLSSSFVLADPNLSESAYSPPLEPNPILKSELLQNDDELENNENIPFYSSLESINPKNEELIINNQKINNNSFGSVIGQIQKELIIKDKQMDDQQKNKDRESTIKNFGNFESDGLTKRRQFSQYAAPQIGIPEIPSGIGNPLIPPTAGACPGGSPLPIECDPKRPWPQCPPQSYCYATNSVDIGPYFCCPVWSTYGAAWRPATPFYNYIPPPPPNWPEQQIVASPRYGPFRKNRKEQNNKENIEEPEEIENNIQNIHKTLNRLTKKQ